MTIRNIICCAALAVAPASAASIVYGGGTIEVGSYLSIDTSYENPVALDVAKLVTILSSQTGANNDRNLAYSGQAQFGRLSARSSVTGGSGFPSNPISISHGVDFYMGFADEIEAQGVTPILLPKLRLDIDLSGDLLDQSDSNFSSIATASFQVIVIDPLDSGTFVSVSAVVFGLFQGNSVIYDPLTIQPGFHGFVPYVGGEAQFIGNSFSAHGYIDVPLYYDWMLDTPFRMEITAGTSTDCESDACTAITDFGHTALIGNARIVNGIGDPIPGASFTSASGYDYLTPPGPLGASAVPEPGTWALLLGGLSVIVMARRRG